MSTKNGKSSGLLKSPLIIRGWLWKAWLIANNAKIMKKKKRNISKEILKLELVLGHQRSSTAQRLNISADFICVTFFSVEFFLSIPEKSAMN